MTNRQLSVRGVRDKDNAYSHLRQQSSMARVSIQRTAERAGQPLEVAETPREALTEVSFYKRP